MLHSQVFAKGPERTQLYLPVHAYIVQGIEVSEDTVKKQIRRTNLRLKNAGIKLVLISTKRINKSSYKSVSFKNIEKILSYGAQNSGIRIFYVKEDLEFKNYSWTYDPVIRKSDRDTWGRAVFLTDIYSNVSDRMYKNHGYLPKSDTLLHELGHILMQKITHYKGKRNNFFHNDPIKIDNTIFKKQISIMRKSPLLVDHLSLKKITLAKKY